MLLNVMFVFPFVGFFSAGTAWVLQMRQLTIGPALYGGFSCQLLSAQGGRICKKYISSRRIKRDSRPLHRKSQTVRWHEGDKPAICLQSTKGRHFLKYYSLRGVY